MSRDGYMCESVPCQVTRQAVCVLPEIYLHAFWPHVAPDGKIVCLLQVSIDEYFEVRGGVLQSHSCVSRLAVLI